ncbi:hypothetical protein AB0L40_15935 [Patulibacter sp. NPDC049589]|uniref:hypothetical protein n=1 Tax=Patulibacter sp. NPDC049589 TaxID=3154731 RepID=UPI00344331A3
MRRQDDRPVAVRRDTRGTRRGRLLVAGTATGVTLAAAGTAGALPPGGAVDKPGTPAASLEITNLAGLREGKVQFCVRGSVLKDGSAPQLFMLKFDDFGSNGIGPFQPDATGTYCGELSTDRTAFSAAADDKIPADLCNGGQHWLRVLSGSWAGTAATATERSLAKDFTSDATCGTGGTAAWPTVGSIAEQYRAKAGVALPSTPPAGTPTTPGGPTTTPGGSTTPGGPTPVPVLTGLAKIRSTTVAVSGSTATLRVRRTAAVGGGKITVRSATRLAAKGRKGKKIRTLVSAQRYALTGAVAQSLRLKLTATGRSVLRTRRSLSAVVTITPTGGKPTTTRVVLRPTKSTKK